jgi:hypothetical protein
MKVGIIKPEETVVARQRIFKHVPVATNAQTNLAIA